MADAEREPSLLQRAQSYLTEGAGEAPPREAPDYAYDYATGEAGGAPIADVFSQGLQAGGYGDIQRDMGQTVRDTRAESERRVEAEKLNRQRPRFDPSTFHVPDERVVGYTRGGMQPDKTQQEQTRSGKGFPLPFWAHNAQAYTEKGQAAGEQFAAEDTRQRALLGASQGIEGKLRDQQEQEKYAAAKMASDQTNALIRMEQARERMSQFGAAPDMTVQAVFDRADGPRKVAGLAAMLMGGVGAAGFSAINHQPNKNPFFETFNAEAQKTLDRFEKDRGAAQGALNAESQGFDAITKAFGDQQSARAFVNAGVLQLYKNKLEQIASQYGIDKNRSDYLQTLAKIDEEMAGHYEKAAWTVQESSMQSQKYVPPQAIKAHVSLPQSVLAQVDPGYVKEGAALQNELARYGGAEYLPPDLQQRVDAYKQRGQQIKAAVDARTVDAIWNPPPAAATEIEKYYEAREKSGVAARDMMAQAAAKLAKQMQGNHALGQKVAAMITASSPDIGQGLIAQAVGPDKQILQEWGDIVTQYRQAISGKAVTPGEAGPLLIALGDGSPEGVANFAHNQQQAVQMGERNLESVYKIGSKYFNARRLIQQQSEETPYYNQIELPQ